MDETAISECGWTAKELRACARNLETAIHYHERQLFTDRERLKAVQTELKDLEI